MATEHSVMAVIRAARPTFRNSHDKVAFAIHASFLSAGFILHSTGPAAFVNDVLSSASTDEVGLENWNEVDDNYAFVYSNPDQGAQKVLVKCLVMNNKLLVDALKEGDSEALHLEIDVSDYAEENAASNYSFKNLRNLIADVDKEILAKLDGSAASSAPQPSSSDKGLRDDRDRSSRGVSNPSNPYVFPHPSGVIVPPLPGSGSSDLFPGPGAGMYPSRGDFGGGSMLIGPHDPQFFGGNRGGVPGLPGGQPGVPPGARFDPFGPPDVPGFEPGRFVRNPRRPGGGGTHPDLQHFGNGSDFI
ncbi:probable proteasome inhibitor [Olea europaea subsp. europaea]|uniref:Probable proteasome inhibitor n=2 Tax=Olea europaea subsp. europaea TaxID=158383 RepID=A0A8S0SDG6_OLEEU|nr:probable proteasome inhibitor [Olea europaea subsp. europaea]